jgi:diguanylate cyclase (GGDEF)-like protein/PAS domain S-box-containing protein
VPESKETKKEKVLIVDNHPLILKFVSDLLGKHGYEVQTAKDGLSAIDVLNTFTPDYIIVDLVMPNINGAALCRIIRGNPRFSQTPLFILSATAAEISCPAESLGADLCIAKGPFPEMGENILQALRNPRAPDIVKEKGEILGLDTIYPRSITRELLEINRHLEVILECISEGILEINQAGRILFINPAAAAYFSEEAQTLLGRDFFELFKEEDRKFVSLLLESDIRVASANCIEHRSRYLSIKSVPIGPDEPNRIVVISDVTAAMRTRDALEQANKALSTLSKTDALTGIANRRWFDDRIQQEWRRMQREKKPLTLLLCDVDHFKQFNDRFGHPAGDDCLRFVSELLSDLIKRPGDLAARYGGDEFALILPDTSEEGAIQLAEKLRSKTGQLDFTEISTGKTAAITLSIGIATALPGESHTPANLLSLADNALYEAKQGGRNRIVFRQLEEQGA